MLHYRLWVKVENCVTLVFQKQRLRFQSGTYQHNCANMYIIQNNNILSI